MLLLRPGRGAEYCDQFVCLCVSVCEHISGTARPIFTNFYADPLWPWLPRAALRYVMYFRLYGWRHSWPWWAVWWCVEGWTFNLLPLAALRYRGGVWCLWMPCFFIITWACFSLNNLAVLTRNKFSVWGVKVSDDQQCKNFIKGSFFVCNILNNYLLR